jgi:predicted thioesterase
MKDVFKQGDTKEYTRLVSQPDSAAFDSGQVHPVYATFALARDAEWACRLFVLEMKEEDEEGIGTFITVQHLSPALIGETVYFTAEVKSIQKNEIICSWKATVGSRLVATGEQGQKILKRTRLDQLFTEVQQKSTGSVK